MKCYRKNGSDEPRELLCPTTEDPSMKCYRKNGSDLRWPCARWGVWGPSMKCYRKNGSDRVYADLAPEHQDPQ